MTEEKLIYQRQIINRILESPFEEAMKIYVAKFNYLQEYSFLLPHPGGLNYVQKFRELNLYDMDVIHFFGSETLYAFNAYSFISDMMAQDYELRIASLASLDTQVQSYIYRNYKDETNKVPQSISGIKQIVESHRCMIDGFAYMFENALFKPDFLKTQICKDNMLALETYFFKDEIEAATNSERILDSDDHLLRDEFSDFYRHQYLLYYLELLVMTDINLNHKNQSLYDKELSFVKYFHEQVHIISEREIHLAVLFFRHGTKIRFFGKIQKGRTDIVKNLRNMAWDIFHLQNTFNNIPIVPSNADFIIPFFITYDKRLKDIAPIYKLKSAAFIKNTTIKQLNFLTDLMNPLIKQNYFSVMAYLERQNGLKGITEKSLIAKLKIEIDKYETLLT